MTVLLCPLCSQPRFNNLESLRVSLVNAATQSISCPICNEVLMGLDKFTIHLFGHTNSQSSERLQCLELKARPEEVVSADASDHKSLSDEQVLKEKDYSNFDQPMEDDEKPKDSDASTVNMEDLSFLTSWENPLKADDLKNSENLKEVLSEENIKEDSTELSDYMSDLLNKKLPILNFVFAMDTPEPLPEKPVGQSEQFKCPTCNFSFQNSIILSMHQELVHSRNSWAPKKPEEFLNLLSPEPKKPPEPPEHPENDGALSDFILPQYSCHLCFKSFKMKGSLLVHYRVAHLGIGNVEPLPGLTNENCAEERSFHCSICKKSFKKDQHLTQHIKTHEGKQWKCETCNKHFTTKYFLKKHQRLHTGEMPYSCQICNKTFTFQQSYHKHLLYHSDEKPHQCSQCGRSFKELSTLHNHQRIHSGEKPFACETCGKCFRQRVSYIVHQRIHTGVLPYQCTACKKKFRYKVSQRSHKCAAQPPGVVVRQSGNLIQRILDHKNDVLQCSQ